MVTLPGKAQFFALFIALLPAFSAGSPPLPYACALLLLTGLAMLYFRPATPLPRSLAYAASALIVSACVAFLPVDWFGRPEWRTTLESYGNVALGTMVTPQPWHTLEGLGMILAGVAFGFFLLCQPVNGQTHEKLAGAFTLGVGAFAAFAIFAATTGWKHPWDIFGTFGFLPNRNHVGTFLAMGAIAGLGTFWNCLEQRRWGQVAPLGAAITLILVAMLNFCESRAASGLLFTGLFIWLAGVFRKSIDRRAAISALVLTLFVLAVFITSQTPAMKRFRQDAPPLETSLDAGEPTMDEKVSDEPVTLGFRWLLYKDTWRMIADHPLSGIGLGNYRYLSQQYRDASLSQALAIHSDNSWLLLAAEAGLPATVAAAALLVLAFLRLRRCKKHPSWSVRWACASAVAIFAGHCALDVPAHRAATLLPALFLAGLAFRQSRAQRQQPCFSLPATRALFVVSGAALLLAALWLGGWIPGFQGKLPSAEIQKAPASIYSLHQQDRTEEAIELVKSIRACSPLDSELYFQQGILELTFEDTDQSVERLFATERLLEPHFIRTPLRQANAWLPINRDQCLRLYADAMERARQQDRRTKEKSAQTTLVSIMQSTSKLPEFADLLYPLAEDRPDLLLVCGQKASIGTFQLMLRKILSSDPYLDHWSLDQQRKLLGLWWRKGDRSELQQLLREHPALEEAAWSILAQDLARTLQFEQAWQSVATRLQIDRPELFQEIATSGRLRDAYNNYKTPIAAERLAKALLKEKDFEGLLAFMAEARAASVQSANLSRMASIAAARLSRWSEAWKFLVAMTRSKYPELELQ